MFLVGRAFHAEKAASLWVMKSMERGKGTRKAPRKKSDSSTWSSAQAIQPPAAHIFSFVLTNPWSVRSSILSVRLHKSPLFPKRKEKKKGKGTPFELGPSLLKTSTGRQTDPRVHGSPLRVSRPPKAPPPEAHAIKSPSRGAWWVEDGQP